MSKKHTTNKFFDERSKKKTDVRLEKRLYDEVEKYRGIHRLPSWSKALHFFVYELMSENASLKEKESSIFNYLASKNLVSEGKLSSESSQECGCEGCAWYDGWDSNRKRPRCLNLNPPIDKRFLSITSGKICQSMQEEQIQLQRTLGKNVTRKNVGVVLTMATKLNTMNAEMEAINRERSYLKNEVARINRDLSSRVVSESTSVSEINALRENLASKESKIQALNDQVSTLQNDLKNVLEVHRKYDVRIRCPMSGELIWFSKECIPCTRESDCWQNCDSFRKYSEGLIIIE